jgi:hypothetical protein
MRKSLFLSNLRVLDLADHRAALCPRLLGPGFAYEDIMVGLVGTFALLSALENRTRTGSGQHIDLSPF